MPDSSTNNNSSSNKSGARADIGLADLLSVIQSLPSQNESHLKIMAESLGFTLPDALFEPDTHKEKTVFDSSTDTPAKPRSKHTRPKTPFRSPPPPELPVELSTDAIALSTELTARHDERDNGQKPEWLNQAEGTFPSLFPQPADQKDDQKIIQPQPRENLFPDLASRGILSATLATYREGTSLDIRKIIANIVAGTALNSLPYEKTTTLDQGCQLLLDYNETLTPYWPDLNELAQQLYDVIGKERVDLFEFKQDPLQAKQWLGRKNSKEWKAEKNRPVLVASNLGKNPIGGELGSLALHTPTNDWQSFIEECQKHKAPLVILFPWQKAALPKDLGNYPIIIHWNPKTSATMIRQLIGRALEVRE